MKALLRDLLTVVVTAAVIILGLQTTAQKFIVEGPSMNSSLQDGQQMVVNKIIYKFRQPQRGDIIVFHPPTGAREDYVKRIIGLPGESIEIKEGIVYIHKEDGTVLTLDEPYIREPARSSFEGDRMPEGNYFVLGDNRNNSSDSRSGWTVPAQSIIGKAWFSVWPPARWGLIANYSTR